jgi:asparagine synthase (glutamine-hydrolysing)
LDELEELLKDSVRRQMYAEVPVGILLSGGVDSSLVTAMAVEVSSKVRTFTVRFPGFGAYDETAHARLIAQRFKTDHIELDAREIAPELLSRLARQYDEPIVDSSMIPTFLVSDLVRSYCTVALGGDGGDELFGGYSHYSRILWMQKRLAGIPSFIRSVGASAGKLLPSGMKGRNYLKSLGVNLDQEVPLIASYADAEGRRRLLGDGWNVVAETILKDRMPKRGDLLQRATRMDFEHYLAEDILVKVDRASMLSSLEMRAPMLDYRLIEFAFRKVPSRLKATYDSRKLLLKRLAARKLPPEFDQQRKQGFSIPLAAWLKDGPWRKSFEQILFDPGSLFDHRAVKHLMDGLDRGRNNSESLFSLALFELWRREYRATLGG